jgi:hypothetical protein
VARMLPPSCPPDTPSEAERRVFRHLQRETPNAWFALHSLGLTKHKRKPWAEADFVVVTPRGVLVLEVKGGAVRRVARQWWTNDNRLHESPFDQAAGASAALYHDLRDSVAAARGALVGNGVCLPDVIFNVTGTDLEPDLVYDARSVDQPFEKYVNRVFDHWHARIAERRSRFTPKPLGARDMKLIIDRLAGDFDLIRSLRGEVGEIVCELVRLTEAQVATFRGLEDNPRVVVQGSAGTGKTLIAVADAERLAARGKRVLLTCHSNALRDHLAARVQHEPKITVLAFQQLCAELIAAGGVADPREAGQRTEEYYDVLRPTAALEAWCDLKEPPEWDALIVDEAQDLLTGPSSDLLDAVLKGGWSGGIWRVYLDPIQDIFGASHRDVIDRICKDAFSFRLQTNCRNTAQIGRDTAIAAQCAIQETLPVQGPNPVWLAYAAERDHLRQFGKQLRSWLDDGIHPEDITILSPVRRHNSVLANGLPPGMPCRLIDGPVVDREQRRGAIQFATVAAFKGLESDVVLLLDAPFLGKEDRSATTYVGMTRARAALAVMYDQKLKPKLDELQQDFGRRLVGAA